MTNNKSDTGTIVNKHTDYSNSGIAASIPTSSADPMTLISPYNVQILRPVHVITVQPITNPIDEPYDWQPGIDALMERYAEALQELAHL